MILKFWGTRAFVPAFFSSYSERDRIAAVLQRLDARDAASDDAKERFFSSLPDYLCESAGLGTSCAQVALDSSDDVCLFDAGTGICGFSQDDFRKVAKYRLFLSAFGWEFIQGLPFFRAAYDAESEIEICAPSPSTKSFLSNLMEPPFFPFGLESFRAKVEYVNVPDFFALKVGEAEIAAKRLADGASFAYFVKEGGKKIVVAPFCQIDKFRESAASSEFFSLADILVLDSQCSVEDAIFGHSGSGEKIRGAIGFAQKFGAKSLVLARLNPNFGDRQVFELRAFAQEAAKRICPSMRVDVAQTGKEIEA